MDHPVFTHVGKTCQPWLAVTFNDCVKLLSTYSIGDHSYKIRWFQVRNWPSEVRYKFGCLSDGVK